MTPNYEIVFQIEEHCARELDEHDRLDETDVDRIVRAAVNLCERGGDPAIREVPHVIELALQLEATLFVVEMGEGHRAIISVDADELFDRLVITLWSYTTHHELHRALGGLVKALYGRYLRGYDGQCESAPSDGLCGGEGYGAQGDP